MRRAARTDSNQSEMVRELRALGYSVEPRLAQLGKGAPDILVGWDRRHHWPDDPGGNIAVEIKDPKKPPSARKLTPDEERWHDTWAGPAIVALYASDVVRFVSFYLGPDGANK